MKNKSFLIILGVIGVGLILWRADIIGKPQAIAKQDHKLFDLQIGKNNLQVEVVTTPESAKLGLGNRDGVGSDGMLFVFPSRRVAAFWMKNMRFDIDIIWIDGDKVIGIAKNIPHPTPNPGTADSNLHQLELYSPPEPIDKVLEVKAGDSERLGIKVGDRVKI